MQIANAQKAPPYVVPKSHKKLLSNTQRSSFLHYTYVSAQFGCKPLSATHFQLLFVASLHVNHILSPRPKTQFVDLTLEVTKFCPLCVVRFHVYVTEYETVYLLESALRSLQSFLEFAAVNVCIRPILTGLGICITLPFNYHPTRVEAAMHEVYARFSLEEQKAIVMSCKTGSRYIATIPSALSQESPVVQPQDLLSSSQKCVCCLLISRQAEKTVANIALLQEILQNLRPVWDMLIHDLVELLGREQCLLSLALDMKIGEARQSLAKDIQDPFAVSCSLFVNIILGVPERNSVPGTLSEHAVPDICCLEAHAKPPQILPANYIWLRVDLSSSFEVLASLLVETPGIACRLKTSSSSSPARHPIDLVCRCE